MRPEHECPMQAIIDSSEALAREHVEQIHAEERERIVGGIAIIRECFDKVRSNLTCDGPAVNEKGHAVCRLQDAVYGTRSIAFGVPNQGAYAVSLEKFAGATEHNNTGQYL